MYLAGCILGYMAKAKTKVARRHITRPRVALIMNVHYLQMLTHLHKKYIFILFLGTTIITEIIYLHHNKDYLKLLKTS